ncbi:MAG: L-seryl-tRNA(Sec) selenium transferase [Verrucomicrobia bacterium]|nr:L-seryl-tRNA(Sec) selenium transferase [Verrucomicrobiota bacterium]
MSRAKAPRHRVPAVEKVLQALGGLSLPRPVALAVIRRELAELRAAGSAPDIEAVVGDVRRKLERLGRLRLQPVLNGTGVMLHTNLGRAPLGPAAIEALGAIGRGYCNLEFELDRGERGGRATYLEQSLALLCGAPAATVVNNCAAALVLILRHFTAGDRREVVISRGELIQIGGGFRIPEILESSGAQLREVGTTNKTALADYARALGRGTALILKVHRSNFFMGGFVESPSTEELSGLARRRRVPLVEDLGSGAVVATEAYGVEEHEPTPAEVLGRGVDLVCCSGDKLLGGPQAGLIAGGARWVGALKRDPFYRALRCDKLILVALETVVDAYLGGREAREVPVLGLLRVAPEQLRARGKRILEGLAGLPLEARLGSGKAHVGGGTLPRAVLTSVTVEVRPVGLALGELAARLRRGTPPVIGYVSGGWLKLDLRTIFPEQDTALGGALRAAAAPA